MRQLGAYTSRKLDLEQQTINLCMSFPWIVECGEDIGLLKTEHWQYVVSFRNISSPYTLFFSFMPHNNWKWLHSLNFHRTGVQFQQAHLGGSQLPGTGLRLCQHHALRAQHVRPRHLPGHDSPAQNTGNDRATGNRTARAAVGRRHRSDETALQMHM